VLRFLEGHIFLSERGPVHSSVSHVEVVYTPLPLAPSLFRALLSTDTYLPPLLVLPDLLATPPLPTSAHNRIVFPDSAGVKRQAGQGESTAHTAPTVFCPFQKRGMLKKNVKKNKL
jgi:hypothetical protein